MLREQPLARTSFVLRHGVFDPDSAEVVLPSFVVGMLASALALRGKPQRLWLAGFDGFDSVERRAEQAEMDAFWSLLRAHPSANGVALASLLPTTYAVPTTSVYGLL